MIRIQIFFLITLINCCVPQASNGQQKSMLKKAQGDVAIFEIIQSHRPMKGARIPANIKQMIGATHVGGKYNFTNEPFLLEGTRKIHELGLGVCKLWFYKNQTGYSYNDTIARMPDTSLVQLALQPLFKKAFDIPFSTFILSTGAGQTNMLNADSAGLAKEEAEYYELGIYLLDQYKHREVNFILENWEGDWIVRGGTGWEAQWGRVATPTDMDKRFKSLQLLFKARQDGVNRARKKIPNTLCKIYHAIEVNKVIDAMYGVPSLTTHVLPFVEVDMVSWSAYDATDFDKIGLDLHKGIDFLRSHIRPTAYVKNAVVFIGEIGIPEMSTKNVPAEFKERWDTYLAVCLAQKLPYFIQWELYCNEPSNGKIITPPAKASSNNELNGFWLIRQDGTKSYAMEYFDEILQNAGGFIKR